ncbi:uncharacterized protein G2W53_039372 [Senna tora]|uniref:Uncharacterized protein n=1 Tax=Senna tora TaxID=362788 RepID=A0A834SPF6_9FABA|nr:uncharacterized protein G2W53_039372 [Senna tora]
MLVSSCVEKIPMWEYTMSSCVEMVNTLSSCVEKLLYGGFIPVHARMEIILLGCARMMLQGAVFV